MRAPLSLLLIGCSVTLLCSCASQTRSVHYSPPSAAPVRDKISSAQSHAKAAKAAIADATATTRKLGILPNASPARTSADTASSLSSSLAAADHETDALIVELLDTQTALKDYETKVADQTKIANDAISDKNEAIRQRDRAVAQDVIDRKHAHRLKLYICGALSIVTFLVAFQFRAILALLGPWGLVGGLAGLPAIAFAIAWKFF